MKQAERHMTVSLFVVPVILEVTCVAMPTNEISPGKILQWPDLRQGLVVVM